MGASNSPRMGNRANLFVDGAVHTSSPRTVSKFISRGEVFGMITAGRRQPFRSGASLLALLAEERTASSRRRSTLRLSEQGHRYLARGATGAEGLGACDGLEAFLRPSSPATVSSLCSSRHGSAPPSARGRVFPVAAIVVLAEIPSVEAQNADQRLSDGVADAQAD